MKFQHLAIGARFEFEGRVYTKTGPVSASAPEGGQRMIPRYADLEPLDAMPERKSRPAPGQLDTTQVRAAFEAFYIDARQRVDTPQLTPLAESRARFYEELGLDAD
jgi:hypothetical protein